jgi:hypothetical protein
VDVSAELMPFPQELEHLDEVVHHLDRTAWNSRGDEQALAPATLMCREEDANQLLRFKQGARHGTIAPHGAVVTVVATSVGHQNAEQRHPHSWSGIQVSDVEGSERSHLLGVSKARRRPFSIICGQ